MMGETARTSGSCEYMQFVLVGSLGSCVCVPTSVFCLMQHALLHEHTAGAGQVATVRLQQSCTHSD